MSVYVSPNPVFIGQLSFQCKRFQSLQRSGEVPSCCIMVG